MGLFSILDRLTGTRPEPRAVTPQDFGRGADLLDWLPRTAAGMDITLAKAMTLSVFARCVNLYVDDVAQLPIDVFRREGASRVPLDAPEWMTYPSIDQNYTWADHVSDVVFSLVTDRNAFIRCLPDRFSPQLLQVLDPQEVEVVTRATGVTYRVRGYSGEMGPDQVLHIRAAKRPGQSRAESRVTMMRETIALGLAAEEYGARFFSNGAVMSGMVEVPAGVQVDADLLRKQMERGHKGTGNSHALGVLTGGATFKPITVEAEKAQLLELKESVVEDVARGFGIPPYLVGSTKPGAVAYASTSNARVDYVVHGVVSIVSRLERAYSDLIPGDDTLVRFNLNALLRGDMASRFAAYQTGLASRFITRDEVRAWEDYGPADRALGVGTENGGYLDTPNNSAPQAGTAPDPSPEQEAPI